MKNVFALLAAFVLLAPAVIASPTPFPGGDDGHGQKCLAKDAVCSDKLGKCCEGYECKDGGKKDAHGYPVLTCCPSVAPTPPTPTPTPTPPPHTPAPPPHTPTPSTPPPEVCVKEGYECGDKKGKCCHELECKAKDDGKNKDDHEHPTYTCSKPTAPSPTGHH